MKQFDIPEFYRSPIIGPLKEMRKSKDPRKQDFTPTLLDFGPVQFYIARHFGFCYGVENAIEISYRALSENPGKQIFLLSQMIHNPAVNDDLQGHGIQFIMDTYGNQLIPWDDISSDDIVITPAFGTTVEIEDLLKQKGIQPELYNTTCPFVEKVWKRSSKLGEDDFTVIIHGKQKHEETRATFSHSYQNAPSLVIKDLNEAHILGEIIMGKRPVEEFENQFRDRASEGFDPNTHFDRIGVVNQTTMLATETQAIADHLKNVVLEKFGEANSKQHFADTRDTLCYATNDNQSATYGLMETDADLAIVVGGYNSSNTSHLVELLEEKFPTYFISSENEIKDDASVEHFNFHEGTIGQTSDFLPKTDRPLKIALTSGASCPDSVVDRVLQKVLSYFTGSREIGKVMEELEVN
ncbi:MAG: 4-hydroxy-3-methylbut-2-enyl diphosphate reductase [Flavobacteriales bacterium]|nr:4-hydroxy-3-methylbut-2-enyl diphosphate reductase [Flavobacteriales bacterium]